ncbi:MAG: c-type cytochrome [Myxococcota bacterium]
MRFILLAAALALAADKTSKMPTKRPPDAEVGERLWKQSCWQCHGEKGRGDGPAAAALPGGVPPLEARDARFDALVTVIQQGRNRMPAYAEDIDKHDARRILVYLKEVQEGRYRKKGAAKDTDEDDAEGGGQ